MSTTTAAVAELPDGGWTFDADKGWKLDDAERPRNRRVVGEALAAIDKSHDHLPKCELCGQRALKLDRYGLCSKTSEPHQQWRARERAATRKERR